MIFSPYQEKVFEYVKDSEGSAFVEAVAGSGKTTTIVAAIEHMKGERIFLAFNKHIAQTLAAKVPYGTEVKTLNAFGHRVVLKNMPKARLDPDKVGNICNYLKIDRKNQFLIKRVVSLLKAAAIYTPHVHLLYDLIYNFSLETNDKKINECLDPILDVFRISLNDKTSFDFDDQIFLPVYHNWDTQTFDWVVVDEAQDLNPIQILLLAKINKGRVLAVGDSHQAIYGFRGADPEAVQTTKQMFKMQELPLSICYRCDKRIVLEAQKVVPHIEPFEHSFDGKVENCKVLDPAQNDFVLCRVTAPLVSECLRFLRKGIKATVLGRDIGKGLTDLIKSLKAQDVEGMLQELTEYQIELRRKYYAMNKEDLVMVLDDRCDTIRALSENCKTLEEMFINIDTLFSDAQSGITFSTIHKAKGLEADTVWILKPELLPHPNAKQQWQKIQENNLKYVAITRAKHVLRYVR